MLSRRAPSTVRDVLLAVAIVGAILGGVFLYAGAWPPILVVESGSMMHCDAHAPACDVPPQGVAYGRFGTIDPGDIVVQKRVHDRDEIRTWTQGGALNYGKPGDVVVFFAYNNTNSTPIIHRAIAWVGVAVEAEGTRYHVEWVEGRTLTYGPEGIYLPELGFDERAGFTPSNGYKPPISGFITKGDNPITNARADQAAAERSERLTDLVQPAWITGRARGELPWLGLVKLVFVSNKVNNPNPTWIRIGNTFAPYDLWTMLGFTVALIVLAPLAIDVARSWRDARAAARDLARGRSEERRAKESEADVPTFEPLDAKGP